MNKKLLYGVLVLFLGFVSACSNSDEYVPNTPDETQQVIYSELFSDSISAFTSVSVSGDQQWVLGSSSSGTYAYMTGYVNSQNLANEDWLISPVIDLSDYSSSYLTFDHVARYFANLATDATVWVSEDYVDGLPSTATWTQLETNPFIDPGSWTFSSSGEISLTQYAGKKIRIAFKYISTSTKAGSWEIKNFVVTSGKATVVTYNYGDGTEEVPYTVLGARVNQNSTSGWVTGYIVGYIWYTSGGNTYFFDADTCSQNTNFMVGDSAGNVYLSQCMAVQLPSGTVRNNINLADHKSYYGQKITLYGTLTNYFGLTGLKNVSYYILADGTTGGTKPVYPIYSETFISRQGDFTVDNKVLPAGFTSIWNASSYGITASGYKSGNYASESWLISPAINLIGYSSIGMSFDHTINKGLVANLKTDQTLWITVDDGTTWTQLTIPTYPAGNNWTFVNSGDIDLNSYIGKTIKVAFKYLSSTSSSASWEVKNFQIYKR